MVFFFLTVINVLSHNEGGQSCILNSHTISLQETRRSKFVTVSRLFSMWVEIQPFGLQPRYGSIAVRVRHDTVQSVPRTPVGEHCCPCSTSLKQPKCTTSIKLSLTPRIEDSHTVNNQTRTNGWTKGIIFPSLFCSFFVP